MNHADTESLERATLAAVPPQRSQEIDGWLLGLDDGTVGRSHSAVPLRHEAPVADTLGRIQACYAAHGLTPLLRIPRVDSLLPLCAELGRRGWRASKPSLTQTGAARDIAQAAESGEVVLLPAPDAAWAALFLGTGADPVDAASRLAILRRSQHTLYASVRSGSEVLAVGAGCFAHGWIGVHGMRTALTWRRRGYAARILSALAQEGSDRGIPRVFLQVEEGNRAAQALYARAGFVTAWAYDYWRAV